MATPEEIESCMRSILARLAPCEISVGQNDSENQTAHLLLQHDCYKSAFDHLIEKGDRPGLFLVHGQIKPGGIDHAWIELEEQDAVYDSTLLRLYRRSCYYEIRGATSTHKYSYWDAMRIHADAQHYGPWHSHSTVPHDCRNGIIPV